MNILKVGAAAVALLALAGTAQAALTDRGGGMIYDNTLNLTWLSDMNYAKTSGYSEDGVAADGSMTWVAANNWADNLVYGGYDDWRLPKLNPVDATCSYTVPNGGVPLQYYGFNCTGGEMSHLFIVDLGSTPCGGVYGRPDHVPGSCGSWDRQSAPVYDPAIQLANFALFRNLPEQFDYWSGTEYVAGLGGGGGVGRLAIRPLVCRSGCY